MVSSDWLISQRVNNEEKGQNFQKISYRTHQYLTGGLKMVVVEHILSCYGW